MGQAEFISCPQCLHHNPVNAVTCELCEWKIVTDDEILKTQAPADIDSNMTVDTSAITLENLDPQVTVAPAVLDANKQNATDKKTFNLAGDLSHFEVLKVLGQGGMGMVYHAKDRTLHRDVALKMLRPLAGSNHLSTEALLDEARMASQLNHPNIVTIYDVARADNSNYIVMEWVDGLPLDKLIPDDGLPLVTAIDYARQIAHGLSSAHQKYIIHRDIKPQNIMLSDQGTLKILDFGIAGLVNHIAEQDDAVKKTNTQTTPAAGTPSYMSPEQAQGFNLDPRSDIFSLGIVVYQMLTGVRPFTGKNSAEVKQAVCAGKFTPLKNLKADLPPEVIQTVNQMLATAKDQRWQSSGEVAEALDGIYNELTYTKNWWQKRHWLTKAAMLLPFILALGWTTKDILFPASTQQLIEQQLAEATKVAILPFNNISGDPTLQLFGDGLAVNLSTDLAKVASEIGDTWIVPATEISRMKEVTPKGVADKYGVELILTGSMQHMGSTRLMVLNLLDAKTGQQLKTTELNINVDDLFDGHALIREQVMALLGWTLSATLATKFKQQRPQLDGAYRHYVDGSGYLYRYDQHGNIDKALTAFHKAVEVDKSYQNAYVGLAETQLRQFSLTDDNSWLERMGATIIALENINPLNSQVNYLFAELSMKRGEYDQAINLYQTSIQQNSSHLRSQTGLAKAYHKNGNSEKAEKIYIDINQQVPNNWRIVSDMGIFYASIANYDKALAYFKKLSELSPNNDLGVRNMAAVYYVMGDLDNAIIYTKEAIDIKPSDRAYSNLGTMLFAKKRYIESINAYLLAVELKDSFYVHWGNLADTYRVVKDEKESKTYTKAAELAEIALQTNPHDASVISDLSYYYASINKVDLANKYVKKITPDDSGADHFMAALTYDELNNIEMAINHLKMAIEKNYPIDEIKKSPLLVETKKHSFFNEL